MPRKKKKTIKKSRKKLETAKSVQQDQQQLIEISKDKKEYFVKELLSWFAVNKRSFFWRKQKLRPFQYALIEILLQKTRAETVEVFIKDFLAKYPGPEQLDSLALEELENLIKPLGLYKQRAIKIKKLSEEILNSGDSVLATDKIYKLPGIGDYVGRMTRIMAFGHELAIVDTNVVRILKRIFDLKTIQDARRDKQIIRLAEEMLEVLSSATIKEYSLALLDFGALVCLPRKPVCEKGISCPLEQMCHYYSSRAIMKSSKSS